MRIRDTRNGSWYWVNTAVNACPHLTHAEKSVYGALASFGGCKELRPTFQQIAERSNTTERFAMKAVKKLTELELLRKETKGGRGHANVYNLLKCPNGCIKCQKGEQKNSVPVGVKRVNKKTKKGVDLDTPIDKNIDKNIDNTGEAKASRYSQLSADVIKLFEEINPACKNYYGNTTQRSASERLINEHGFKRVKDVIGILPQSNAMPYVPTITTPYQLEQKWAQLENALKKKKNEIKSKGKKII